MSLFSGMARQAAALPPPVQQAPPAPRRGLIGGSRQPQDWSGFQTFLRGTDARDAERARQLALQQAAVTRQNEDRLRAELSPADGPMGSGTGAAPDITQQMAALDDARLRDPAVAERFAPIVQQRRMQDLMRGRPIEEQLATELNPEQAGRSYATQFEDMMGAEGSRRSRGATTINENPKTMTVNDTIYSVGSGGARPLVTAPPAYGDVTIRQVGLGNLDVAQDRLGLDRENSGFTLGQNQTRFNTDGSPVASVTPPAASNQSQASSALNAISNTREAIDRARGQTGFWTTGPLAALPFNTPSRDLNATLDTVKANLSFNELAQMRANSPTGGALGSIAVRELDLLGSTVASLDQSQSKEELERSLGIIEQSLNRWEQAVRAGQTQAPQPQSQGGGQVAYDASGRRYVVRNGQWVPE